jgi:hypothetical protein
VTKFRKYKMSDSMAFREFYTLLRAVIKEARVVGHLQLFVNEQILPSIIGNMMAADLKQWAVCRMMEEIEKLSEDMWNRNEGMPSY